LVTSVSAAIGVYILLIQYTHFLVFSHVVMVNKINKYNKYTVLIRLP